MTEVRMVYMHIKGWVEEVNLEKQVSKSLCTVLWKATTLLTCLS